MAAPDYRNQVLGQFLTEHPEWESHTRLDPELGLLMDTDCTIAFAYWAEARGDAPRGKARALRAALRRFTGQEEPADN